MFIFSLIEILVTDSLYILTFNTYALLLVIAISKFWFFAISIILSSFSEYNVSIAAVKKYFFASYKMIGSPNRKSDTNLEDISDELKNILLCQLV